MARVGGVCTAAAERRGLPAARVVQRCEAGGGSDERAAAAAARAEGAGGEATCDERR